MFNKHQIYVMFVQCDVEGGWRVVQHVHVNASRLGIRLDLLGSNVVWN